MSYRRALDAEQTAGRPRDDGPSVRLSYRTGVVTALPSQARPEVDGRPATNTTGRTLTVGAQVCMWVGSGHRLVWGVLP